MKLLKFAEQELKLLRGNEEDKMQDLMEKDILEIVKVFSKQEHSATTAYYCINILNKLLRYEPLTPLTGEKEEWIETTDGLFQNKRLSSIFKDKNKFGGKPYWIDGKVFSNDNGKTWFTSKESIVFISFPFIFRNPEKIIKKS